MQQVSPLTQQYLASRQNGGLTFNSPVSYSNGMASAPMPALMTQQNNDVYVPEAQDESQNADVQKADKKKKTLKIAAIIAGIGAVAGIAYLIIKKKNAKDAVKQLTDVKVENGAITLKDGGKKLTGTLEHTVKAEGEEKASTIVSKVKDGVVESTKIGEKTLEFSTDEAGKRIAKITTAVEGAQPTIVNTEEQCRQRVEKLANFIDLDNQISEGKISGLYNLDDMVTADKYGSVARRKVDDLIAKSKEGGETFQSAYKEFKEFVKNMAEAAPKPEV